MPHCLDQRQVPGASRLFTDYLYAYERVGQWYGAQLPPFAPESLAAAARGASLPAGRRQALADALAQAHRDLPPSAVREANLARLRLPDTVAIVAGQQVGLFGGPLLTILKALTAIKLAERLQSQGQNAVPLFWLASQDHDLAEINAAWALNREARPQRIAVETAASAGRVPVGRVRLGPGIATALAQWRAVTGGDGGLADCYRPEATFASAFRELMARWFEPWGLLFIDPLDPPMTALAAETLSAAVARAPELLAALSQRSEELKAAGYHAQVETEDGAALLFGEQQGQRVALRYEAGTWSWGAQRLESPELMRRIAAEPHLFSPAALLRPVVQDALLPTAAQVCGPAETAYLAQSAALYRELERRQPLVYPRVSATLLEPRVRRWLEKYGLTLPQIWQQPPSPDPGASLGAKLARETLPPGLEQALAALRGAWEQDFQRVVEQIRALDPTLPDFATTAGAKMRHQLDQIENRVSRALARRQDDLERHARGLVGALFPERHMQERLLTGAIWADAIPVLHARIVPECADHQAIEL